MSIRKGRLTSQGLIAAPVNFPSGTILDFSGPVAPQGWLLCDGSAISRTDYAALFAVIGTIYGVGDGSTTFNLPDLRGEFRRGLDNMGSPAGARGKDVDGTARTVGQGQADAFKAHFHTHDTGGNNPTGTFHQSSATSEAGFINTGTTGGSETRPTNLAFPVIIKF